jgi:ribosomal protein S18 acetylase RimI-like enzyme
MFGFGVMFYPKPLQLFRVEICRCDDMGTMRRMSLEDIDDALSVFAASFEDAWNHYERDYYPRKALEFDFERVNHESCERRMQEPNDFLFVIEECGKVVGGAIGGILRGNDKEGGLVVLSSIYVHPLHQRKGLGEALLNHVLEYCKHRARADLAV